MSNLSHRSFLRSQMTELDRLIELAEGDPFMEPGLRSRRNEVEEELRAAPEWTAPRTVLYFSGRPVSGSTGIDAEFAAKVIEPFLGMVKTHYAALAHGIVGARGPRRGEAASRLLLTGLPRGSFGLELSRAQDVEQPDLFTDQQLADTLVDLAKIVDAAKESDEKFAATFSNPSPRLLQGLTSFLHIISEWGAGLRLLAGEAEATLTHAQATEAYDRVSGTTSETGIEELWGTFRGATLDSGRFDFRSQQGRIISGGISEEIPEEEVADINRLTNKQCLALFSVATLTTRSGVSRKRYELASLTPSAELGLEAWPRPRPA